jgi:uncharacterized protein YbjT (DUF2867 family)
MIGVIGGTGTTGRGLVAALKAKGAEFRCLVRDTAAAAETLGSDVELVQADVDDAASIEAGLAGCDKLFLLTGHSPAMAGQQIGAIEAAKRAGVTHVVKLSGGDAIVQENTEAKIGRAHWEIEEALKASGLEWTILRPGFFMQNFLNMAGMVKGQGKVMMPVPADVDIGMIDVRDTGDVAASVLTSEGHNGKTYFLAGPNRTPSDFTAALSKELGKEIPFVQVPMEGAVGAMKERGMPDWLIDHQAKLMGILGEGKMAGTNDYIEQFSGHAPRSLEDFVKDNAGAFSD